MRVFDKLSKIRFEIIVFDHRFLDSFDNRWQCRSDQMHNSNLVG